MPFSPQKTSRPVDAVKVLIKGTEFADWYSVDMDSDFMSPADAFSLTGTVPAAYLGLFREGNTCDVYVGDDRQMAGVIDDVTVTLNENVRVAISGRDLGGYLVDSEAKAEHFSNYHLAELAKHLLRPEWGIKNVIVSNDDNRKVQLGKKERERFKPGKKQQDGSRKPRAQTKIDPGQTVRQILDEHCMRARLTWWITAQGDLVIGKPQYDQYLAFEFFCYAPGSANAKRYNNVLAGATVKRSSSERYSEIVVVGQSNEDASSQRHIFEPTDDQADAVPTKKKREKKYRGVATDPDLVARGISRRLIITDNDALSSQMCQEKADADMGRRRLSALQINLTAPNFRQNGKVFTIDCLARVVIEEAGIDGVYWISQRKMVEERSKRRTSLTLHEKGVWLA